MAVGIVGARAVAAAASVGTVGTAGMAGRIVGTAVPRRAKRRRPAWAERATVAAATGRTSGEGQVPVKFRCTGCRSKLYVPVRWTGTSVECPRCRTRVVVPPGAGDAAPATLEGPDIERSLDALEASPAGAFEAAPFTIGAEDSRSRRRRGRSGARSRSEEAAARGARRTAATVTLPAWVPYALAASMVVVGVASFFLGAWWAIAGKSP